jgi:hypothetical protein
VLKKTTILPDDAKLAERLFSDLVHNQPYYLFVALGGDRDAELVAERADRLAGLPEEPRWVVWARKPESIAKVVAKLVNADRVDLGSAQAFSLSLSDEVRDVITADEPVPNLTRILLAFATAEA